MSLSYNNGRTYNMYRAYDAILPDGNSLDSGFLDMSGVGRYQVHYWSDAAGLELIIESKDDVTQTALQTSVSNPESNNFLGTFPARQSLMRFVLQNSAGGDVSVSFVVKALMEGSPGASVFPLGTQPTNFSGAQLTRSVMSGQDATGFYQNVRINEAGALLASDFGTEVSRGLYEGYEENTKFGRNPDIDTTSAPEDMWNGGAEYTGFNATADETLNVFSASANDTGAVVSSGTATDGSQTSLVDIGATFATDGVVAGDCVVNITKGVHGFVTAVTETELTIFRMTNGASATIDNDAGDSYKIVTATGSGASLVRLFNLLDSTYAIQVAEYVVLNGVTPVTTTGSYMRCPNVRSIQAGASGLNEGEVTVRQSATAANVMAVMPTTGRSTIGCFTVPLGQTMLIKRVRATITRANGSAGSATILLNIREFGGAWNAINTFEIQTGATVEYTSVGATVLSEGTDVKFTISQVSDNGTIAEGAFEYFLVEN